MAARKPKIDDIKMLPTRDIRYMLGKINVATPMAEVVEKVEKRCKRAGAGPRLVRACGRYARVVHTQNREEYLAVNRGIFPKTHEQRARLRRAANAFGRAR